MSILEQQNQQRETEQLTTETRRWPAEKRVYLTLDLECDFGTALSKNTYLAAKQTDRLATLLEATATPLTCFLQTELLNEDPEAVEQLRSNAESVTFHPHSHTHLPRAQTSIRREIETSTEKYAEFFGTEPEGYRFPNGNVRPTDYRLLSSFDYLFNASIFPTWRPGHFNNSRLSMSPQYFSEFDLFELPFTVSSSIVRIPTGLSYCRLFGHIFMEYLFRSPPSTIVFNIHMHDLYTPETVNDLPPFYRAVYSRNDHGFKLLREIITRLRQAGYTFETLDTAHTQLRS